MVEVDLIHTIQGYFAVTGVGEVIPVMMDISKYIGMMW